MFLLTERKRKFQPEFIFHLSCMGFDKGCSLAPGRLLKRKWVTFEPMAIYDAALDIKPQSSQDIHRVRVRKLEA